MKTENVTDDEAKKKRLDDLSVGGKVNFMSWRVYTLLLKLKV
jgi:hypothetical protein